MTGQTRGQTAELCVFLETRNRELEDELTTLKNQLRWIPVSERLPEDNRAILARVQHTRYFQWLRAQYAHPSTLIAYVDDDSGEYDEDTDTYYCTPGWYETNGYEEIHWSVGDPVTHWLELPPEQEPV